MIKVGQRVSFLPGSEASRLTGTVLERSGSGRALRDIDNPGAEEPVWLVGLDDATEIPNRWLLLESRLRPLEPEPVAGQGAAVWCYMKIEPAASRESRFPAGTRVSALYGDDRLTGTVLRFYGVFAEPVWVLELDDGGVAIHGGQWEGPNEWTFPESSLRRLEPEPASPSFCTPCGGFRGHRLGCPVVRS